MHLGEAVDHLESCLTKLCEVEPRHDLKERDLYPKTFEHEITADELKHAIENLKEGKASADQELHTRMLTLLGLAPLCSERIFTWRLWGLATGDQLPSRTALLPKRPAPTHASHYRGICLQHLLVKAYWMFWRRV